MKISVAICTYNGEKYIKEQLNSILNQTRKVDEIVICDDRSTDKTLSICDEMLKNSGITYQLIINESPLKVVKNFEKCYSLCSGDLIFSCDQDDIWLKNKVEVIENVFIEHKYVDMVATDAYLIDENLEKMKLSLKESLQFSMKDSNETLDSLLKSFCITGATMAIRKDFVQKINFYSTYWLHDGWLAMIAALNNSFLYIEEKLIMYRLHGENTCGIWGGDLLKNGTVQILKKEKIKEIKHKAIRYPFYYEDYANERKNMYSEFLDYFESNHLTIPKNNYNKLSDCIYFWEKRSKIRDYGFLELLKMIYVFVSKNKYEMYCEGSFFSYFDIYFWLIYKLIPRKKKRNTK